MWKSSPKTSWTGVCCAMGVEIARLKTVARILRDLPRWLPVWWSLGTTRRRLRHTVGSGDLDLHAAETPRARWRLSPEEVRRWRRRVDLAARFYPRQPTCLARCLCLRDWLARQGQAADLRIGVRRCDDALKAHAWLEIEGQAVTPAHAPSFAPLRPTAEMTTPEPAVN